MAMTLDFGMNNVSNAIPLNFTTNITSTCQCQSLTDLVKFWNYS